MMWLFDSHPVFIAPDLYPRMVDLNKSNEEEYAAKISRNAHCKKKQSEANTCANLQKFLKSCIESTPPADGATQTHNSPILIEGDDTITPVIVKKYMQEGMNDIKALVQQCCTHHSERNMSGACGKHSRQSSEVSQVLH